MNQLEVFQLQILIERDWKDFHYIEFLPSISFEIGCMRIHQ